MKNLCTTTTISIPYTSFHPTQSLVALYIVLSVFMFLAICIKLDGLGLQLDNAHVLAVLTKNTRNTLVKCNILLCARDRDFLWNYSTTQ